MNVERERSLEKYNLVGFTSILTIVLAALECIAVAHFAPRGILFWDIIPIAQVVFAMIGIIVVLARIRLEKARQLAMTHQMWGIAKITQILIWISLVLSLLGMMHLYLTMMEYRVKERIADSAPFRIAQLEMARLQTEMESLAPFKNLPTTNSLNELLTSVNNSKDTLLQSPAKNSRNQRTGDSVKYRVGDCAGNNWYQQKYCPRIREYNKQIFKIEADLGNARRFAAVGDEYLFAKEQLVKTEMGNAGSHHEYDSLFYFVSNFSGLSPFAAVVILGFLFCVFLLGTMYVLPAVIPLSIEPIPRNPKQPRENWFNQLLNKGIQIWEKRRNIPEPKPVQPPIQTPVQAPIQTPVQAPIQTPVQAQAPIQEPVQDPVQKQGYGFSLIPKQSKQTNLPLHPNVKQFNGNKYEKFVTLYETGIKAGGKPRIKDIAQIVGIASSTAYNYKNKYERSNLVG